MNPAVVQQIRIYCLNIPLRGKISHATAERAVADSVVVAVELQDGTTGYGETVPRAYVTGETVDSVVDALQRFYVPALLRFHPSTFPDALEAIESLPWGDSPGLESPAARCAVELALLDVTLRRFRREMDDVVRWMDIPGFGLPGSFHQIRFSGVVAADARGQAMRKLRLMYWGGLRQFKLKVGFAGDVARVNDAANYLRRAIRRGQASLRLDANGAWSRDQAVAWLAQAADLPIAAVEQPLARGAEEGLVAVRAGFSGSIVHDESLITRDDGQRLINRGSADVFNIRISKCGGLIPSIRLAAMARRANVGIQLGCMVGETSILARAGLCFLQMCPGVRWAEGCFGTWLLAEDIVGRSLRFGYGGRPPRLVGQGVAPPVQQGRLERLSKSKPIVLHL